MNDKISLSTYADQRTIFVVCMWSYMIFLFKSREQNFVEINEKIAKCLLFSVFVNLSSVFESKIIINNIFSIQNQILGRYL